MRPALFFSLLITIIISSCGTTLTGYDFKTIATYSAVKSNLEINLIAIGKVKAGEDLGEGNIVGSISFGKADSLNFRTHGEKLSEIQYQQKIIEINDSDDFTKSLVSAFDKINYTSYDQQEIKELGEIIKAASRGPKGTYMSGQTKLIRVDKVEFEGSNHVRQ